MSTSIGKYEMPEPKRVYEIQVMECDKLEMFIQSIPIHRFTPPYERRYSITTGPLDGHPVFTWNTQEDRKWLIDLRCDLAELIKWIDGLPPMEKATNIFQSILIAVGKLPGEKVRRLAKGEGTVGEQAAAIAWLRAVSPKSHKRQLAKLVAKLSPVGKNRISG